MELPAQLPKREIWTLVLLFALASIAAAGPRTSHSKSQSSKPICAREKWNATGIHVRAGEIYVFRFEPSSDLADAGILVRTLDAWPPSLRRAIFTPLAVILRRRPCDPWFALIGTVDRRHSFRVRI